jgi:proteasome lid subunit RPN8/RPN11
MDDEIQFGEVEQASPQTSLRPDRNKHFAVAAYGSPEDRDLPIFVDLDVLQDMEDHALSDTSVELGGVLLGQTCTDEDGRPFIVVTDSLRAQHYESTKGSFTFTHDTWSAITREREEFPADLAMVGWYHTHPDWGVFLSGMDMFICDNFFNKPLDLAYVIDPCRGDRGMFQWTGNRVSGDKSQRVRRTGGFFVTASRFREAELEHYVAELSGAMPATTSRASVGSHSGAPVVHLHQPAAQPPPAWQVPTIVGMLALQFCVLALIAWKMVDPAGGALADKPATAADTELAELKEAIAAKAAAEAALEKVRLRTEMLDQMAAEMRGAAPGFVERMQEKFDQTTELRQNAENREAKVRELQTSLDDVSSKLRLAENSAISERERLNNEIGRLEKKLDNLTKEKERLVARINILDPPKTANTDEGDAQEGEAASSSFWWYIGGGVAAAVVLIAGAIVGGKLLGDKPSEEPPPSEDSAEKPGERE